MTMFLQQSRSNVSDELMTFEWDVLCQISMNTMNASQLLSSDTVLVLQPYTCIGSVARNLRW